MTNTIEGFTLNPMPVQLDPVLLARLAKAETATVGHYRHDGFIDPAIHAQVPGLRIAGTAVTVAIPGADSTLLHHVMGLVRPGDVLVIDRCGDRRHACFGGVLALVARLTGIAGAIIDGMVTDVGEIRHHGVPVWARGPSPITTKLLAIGGRLNVPVSCGGVAVNPGDAILADESGVLVLRPHEVGPTADVALERQARTAAIVKDLNAGKKLGDLSGATAKIEAALAKQAG